jgi:hypothetical protein
MPPHGVSKDSKRGRQYEHIKESERRQGVPESRAEEIAARTVNKERARSGESSTGSRSSTEGHLIRPAWWSALRQARATRTHP